jgi:hypothetical protein
MGNESKDINASTDEAAPVDGLVMPVPLTEELRIEAGITPARKGQLYAIAADEIERLRSYLDCDPTITLCPRCGNDITKCDGFYKRA